MMANNTIRKLSAYLFLLVVIIYIITGYGITQFRTVEKLTFGLLTKPLAFDIHSVLIIPLIIFALAHLYFSCSLFRKWPQKKIGKRN